MLMQLELEQLVASATADIVSVAYRRLADDQTFQLNASTELPSASTMKVCVLMELFRQANSCELSLEDTIPIHLDFRSLADGTPFRLSAEDDSEKSLYDRIGESESLLNLAKPMITVSSNLATNLILERIGASKVTTFMSDLGAPSLKILRGVVDLRAFELGLNNSVSAEGLTTILTALARFDVVSETASKAMLEILFAQTHRDCIPAGLPLDTPCANKTGWYDGICHDTAIVYPKVDSPYVLTVLTSGIADRSLAQELIADISRLIFRFNAEVN